MSGGVSTFELAAVLSIRDLMSNKLGEIRKEWNSVRKSMADASAEAQLFDRSASMTKWGAGLTVAGGAAIAFSKSLVQANLEVSKLESNIRSLGVTKAEMEGISSSVRKMSGDMGTAQEVYLTGIYDLKSAVSSLDPKQISDVSLALDQTAKATKGDFADMSKLFGMTYAQFKDMYQNMSDTDFAGMFGNTITIASNLYRTDGAAMNQAMQSLGATASSLKVSFEEQSTVLGMLQNTMKEGVAGTSYRAFLSNISKGMNELGLSAKDSQGKLKSMPELLKSIQSVVGNDIDPDELEKLTKAFTIEGAQLVTALLPKYSQLKTDIIQIKEANKNGNWDDMKKAASINMDNLSGQLDRASSGWGALKSMISSGFNEGPLKSIVKGLADMIGGFVGFLEKHPAVKTFFATLVFGGAVVLTLGGLILTLTGILGMYAAIKKTTIISEIAHNAQKVVSIAQTSAQTIAQGSYNAVMGIGNFLHRAAEKDLLVQNVLKKIHALQTLAQTSAHQLYNAAMSTTIMRHIQHYAQLASMNVLKGAAAIQTFALTAAYKGYNLALEIGRILHIQAMAGAVAFRGAQIAGAVTTAVLTGAQWALNTAFLACPLVWIIMAIGALGAAIYGLVKYWDKVTDAIKAAWNWIKKFFGWKDEVDVDGVVADKIKKLNDQTEKLKEQQNKWQAAGMTGTAEYKKNVEQIKQNEDALKKLNEEMDKRKAVGARIQELKDYSKTLEDLQKTTKKGSADYNLIEAQKGYVESVRKQLTEGLNKNDYKMTEAIMGKSSLDQVKNAGKKLSETFASGIKDSKDVENAVKKMVEDQIGRYLPHSDAKAGPLSRLTASGRAFVSTFGGGVDHESKQNQATQRFVNLQAKTIKESSPVIQKITNASRKIEAKSMVGNLQISLGGKKMSPTDFAALFLQMLETQIDEAG
jgi:TP901 family phage tail tape measure protein